MKNLKPIDSEILSKVIFKLTSGDEGPGGSEQLRATPDKVAMTPEESFNAKKAGCEHLGKIARGQEVETGPAIGEAIGCTDQDGRAINALGDAPEQIVSTSNFINSFNDRLSAAVGAIEIPDILSGYLNSRTAINAAKNGQAINNSFIEGQVTEGFNQQETRQLETNQPGARETAVEHREAVKAALSQYLTALAEAYKTVAATAAQQAGGSTEKQLYAKRLQGQAGLMTFLAQNIAENGINWSNDLSFESGSQAVASAAQAEEASGVHSDAEGTAKYAGGADIPWCGAFAKSCIEAGGVQLPNGINWNVAASYVEPNGQPGEHVAICIGGGMMIGGNQGNAVTACSLPGDFRFNTVSNLEQGIQTSCEGEPQAGDIIVTNRKGNKNFA